MEVPRRAVWRASLVIVQEVYAGRPVGSRLIPDRRGVFKSSVDEFQARRWRLGLTSIFRRGRLDRRLGSVVDGQSGVDARRGDNKRTDKERETFPHKKDLGQQALESRSSHSAE